MKKSEGYLLVYAVVFTFILLSVGVSLLSLAGAQYRFSKQSVNRKNAEYTAKACARVVAERVNVDESYTGLTDEVVFDGLNSNGGQSRCTASISSVDEETKIADIIASVFQTSSDSNPVKSAVRIVLKKGESAGGTSQVIGNDFLVMAGPGGMTTKEDNMFRGSNSVYVMGRLTLDENTVLGRAETGSSAANPPMNIYVANKGCGSGASYPQLCTSPNNKVTTDDGTKLIGNVCIAGDNISSGAVQSGFGQGLISGCVPPEFSLPTFDKASFTEKMTNTATSNMSNCDERTITVPANTVFNGNFFAEECTIHIQGDIYVKGSINFDNETRVYVSDSVGGVPPVFIANGSVILEDSTLYVNSQQTGATFISFKSSDSACSNSPTCNELDSPSKLQASQSVLSVELNDDVSFRDATVWAYFGRVHFKDNNTVSRIIGQSITMDDENNFLPFRGNGNLPEANIASNATWEIIDYWNTPVDD